MSSFDFMCAYLLCVCLHRSFVHVTNAFDIPWDPTTLGFCSFWLMYCKSTKSAKSASPYIRRGAHPARRIRGIHGVTKPALQPPLLFQNVHVI